MYFRRVRGLLAVGDMALKGASVFPARAWVIGRGRSGAIRPAGYFPRVRGLMVYVG